MAEILQELEMLADEKYRLFHSRLIPETGHRILGVRVPQLWKLARRLAKEEGEAYLLTASDGTYEEILLQGMVIALLREDFSCTLRRLPGYMAKIDNWAECDVVCSGLKKCGKHQEETLAFLKPWLASEREYEVRFAVVLLMSYFIDDDHIEETLDLLEQVSHPGYYVKMAVAWAVSVCFVKYPELTLERIKEQRFDSDTHNKALQKILESNRVDREMKARIRKLK